MNQSGYIAAFLVIGFIIYVTMKEELTTYRDIIGV